MTTQDPWTPIAANCPDVLALMAEAFARIEGFNERVEQAQVPPWIFAQLQVGENLDPPDKGVQEALFKMTVQKESQIVEFHVHATDLGWRLGPLMEIRHAPGGKPCQVYTNIDDVADALRDHLLTDEAMGGLMPGGESPFEAHGDPLQKLFWYRCARTGKEWKFTLAAIKRSKYREVLAAPEGRQALADYIAKNRQIPHSEDITT